MYNILFQSWEEIEISNMKNEETLFLCLWQWAPFFLSVRLYFHKSRQVGDDMR